MPKGRGKGRREARAHSMVGSLECADSESWPQVMEPEPERLESRLAHSLSEAILGEEKERYVPEDPVLGLLETALGWTTEGVGAMVEDSFTNCFLSQRHPHVVRWNWNVYLFPAYCLGVVLRYVILFPLRLLTVLLGSLLFAVSLLFVKIIFVRSPRRQKDWERVLLSYLAKTFVMSWSAVIAVHGVMPRRAPNQVIVANHSSMIDYVILLSMQPLSAVGQKHPGWLGFVQDHVLRSLDCMWFDRKAAKDRATIAQRVKKYVADPTLPPLIIFPEGTCVNNEYCVQFKKGAFEIGATVVPVAIKYNKIFVDAFWNSRTESFLKHLFNIMTSWCLVCDVWLLDEQEIRPGESPAQFADRVKELIANKAGLKSVHWDGYLKYFRIGDKFKVCRQRLCAERFRARFRLVNTDQEGPCTEKDPTPHKTPLRLKNE